MLALAALLTIAPPADDRLMVARQALEAGRVEQAQTMVAEAIGSGSRSAEVDRLAADIAAARGRPDQALASYLSLIQSSPSDPQLLESAALSAWRSGKHAMAADLAGRATMLPGSGWKSWNLLGIAADDVANWKAADKAYGMAMALAPGAAEPLNNLGWSHLLRGQWERALTLFRQASALDPALPRLSNNLDLAQAALTEELPSRRPGESMADWAARLNDAGVAAERRGERPRAIAAFTRAVDIRDQWFARAANNLDRVCGGACRSAPGR